MVEVLSDKPIIFSALMVRALLDGRKTMTRRVLKPQPIGRPWFWEGDEVDPEPEWFDGYEEGLEPCGAADREVNNPIQFRYRIGDRIWVREAWRTFASMDDTKPRDLWHHGCGRGAGIMYEADRCGLAITKDGERFEGPRDDANAFGKLRSPMFMPRWASRITLIVTDVRVERLQNISAADCYAEGCFRPDMSKALGSEVTARDNARNEYRDIWDRINDKSDKPGCAWKDNPWVTVLAFSAHHGNIDSIVEAA